MHHILASHSVTPQNVRHTVAIVIASHFIIFKTVFGLRLRSVGEQPQAADTLGISVAKMRYTGVIISGALSGMAGAYLSLEHAHYFVKGISAGRGFIGWARGSASACSPGVASGAAGSAAGSRSRPERCAPPCWRGDWR